MTLTEPSWTPTRSSSSKPLRPLKQMDRAMALKHGLTRTETATPFWVHRSALCATPCRSLAHAPCSLPWQSEGEGETPGPSGSDGAGDPQGGLGGAASQWEDLPPPRMDPPSLTASSTSTPCTPHPLHRERQRQTEARKGGLRPGSDLLEEVLLAVDAPGPGEAPVSQLHLAVCTLEAGAVPVSVQDLQDELVQDMLVAAGALGDLCGERREGQREPPTQPGLPDHPRGDWMPSHSASGGRGRNPNLQGCRIPLCRL